MSVLQLIQLFLSTSDVKYLMDSVLALEFGLTRSASNFHFKLLLVRLYTHPAIGQ